MKPDQPRVTVALGLLTALVLGFCVRTGWNHMQTDFPNYYTGAVAASRGLPLQSFYDWTWFQREINRVGIERQLGAYTPQTPVALIPFLPLVRLAPQRAKQVWISVNIVLLAGSIWLLATTSGLTYTWLFLILLASMGALRANLVLGQYYIFLTFLLALSAWCLFRKRPALAGSILGTIFALKLYSAPFLVLFLVKRSWKAAAGFVCAALALVLVSLAMFGWEANFYYVQSILPRVMSGMLIDPYHPGQGSVAALLRRTFVFEPELNPFPLVSFPEMATFLQSVFTLGISGLLILATRKQRLFTRREFAWVIISLLLLAPVNATYVFAILIVPAALLLPKCSRISRWCVLGGLALLGMSFSPGLLSLFPRVWILAALFLWSGWEFLRRLAARELVLCGLLIVSLSAAITWRAGSAHPEHFERLVQSQQSFAEISPAVSADGFIYQTIDAERYILRNALRSYVFEGHAFRPASSPALRFVVFELVSQGHSRLLRLNQETAEASPITATSLDAREPAVSSDGQLIAFVSNGFLWLSDRSGSRSLNLQGSDPSFTPDASHLLFVRGQQICLLSLRSGETKLLATMGSDPRHPVLSPNGTLLAFSALRRGDSQIFWQSFSAGNPMQLTFGSCNHESPVWEGDSQHLLFTSDCGRGLGLPGLYRAAIPAK